MTAPAVLGPNDLVPCPSHSARRRHQAHGESCRVCWPAGLPGPDPHLDAVLARTAHQSRTTTPEETP